MPTVVATQERERFSILGFGPEVDSELAVGRFLVRRLDLDDTQAPARTMVDVAEYLAQGHRPDYWLLAHETKPRRIVPVLERPNLKLPTWLTSLEARPVLAAVAAAGLTAWAIAATVAAMTAQAAVHAAPAVQHAIYHIDPILIAVENGVWTEVSRWDD